MFINIIFIINLLFVHSFVKFNKIKLNKLKMFDYEEFDYKKNTYTIIGNLDKKTYSLLNDVKQHKVNYVFIDKNYYDDLELVEICKYYSVDKSIDIFNDILVFFEDKKYIGGAFELYQIMVHY